ncbi:MAG: transglutaminase-like domain-containing protein [Candidatus Omnitrophica bacterium]|nr:transglutaminase-like domain-containing protein [Candidatus Omnitrophota bacterium]
MRISKRFVPILIGLGLIFAFGIVMNTEVSIRQGVNGRVHEIRMPLYIKAMEFLSRHYEYQRIAKEITKGCDTEEKKVLAILRWTHENIKLTPPGMPVVDDHILNIIIRGYGEIDQSQDVFTTLCSYSGIPAFWSQVYTKDHRTWYPFSFVKLGGKWRVFDSYYGTYFRMKNGEIASVEDIIADKSIIEESVSSDRWHNGVPYKEFCYNLKPVSGLKTLRSEKQMALKRVFYEVKKTLGIEKEELDSK